MKIELIDKAQLRAVNKLHFGYPLAITEKDYLLAVLLQIIYSSGLKDKLIFKGGTAIHHLYLDQLRFSEDLDFTALEPVSIDDVKEAIEPYEFLEKIVKYYPSSFALKIKRVKFTGPLGQANSIKIDINLEQKLVLPTKELVYRNIYDVPVKVRSMALKENVAEKFRAITEQARYRDFYDLAMIDRYSPFEPKEIIEILKHKESKTPLNKETVLKNFKKANDVRKTGGERLYYQEKISDEAMVETINRLLDLVILPPK